MVRRFHVATEFICVVIGNGHCTSDKLVEIRHSVCDKALGERMTVWRCVASQQRRPCACDRSGQAHRPWGCKIEVRTRQRNSVATDLDSEGQRYSVATDISLL